NDRNIVVRVRGYLNVNAGSPMDLRRTLGIYADDGARLSIGGVDLTVPDVNEQRNARRLQRVGVGSPGLHPLELISYPEGSAATLQLTQSAKWIPEATPLGNLHEMDFRLVGEPRDDLFANSELYTSRSESATSCVECSEDGTCPKGSYCVKDFGPAQPGGLC